MPCVFILLIRAEKEETKIRYGLWNPSNPIWSIFKLPTRFEFYFKQISVWFWPTAITIRMKLFRAVQEHFNAMGFYTVHTIAVQSSVWIKLHKFMVHSCGSGNVSFIVGISIIQSPISLRIFEQLLYFRFNSPVNMIAEFTVLLYKMGSLRKRLKVIRNLLKNVSF